MARPISADEVTQLKAAVAALMIAPDRPLPNDELASACRTICRLLALRYPGGTVELRVPPYAAVQLGLGDRGRHTRGTPPNVVQSDPVSFLKLASGQLTWVDASAQHVVQASGVHADLTQLWPLPELT